MSVEYDLTNRTAISVFSSTAGSGDNQKNIECRVFNIYTQINYTATQTLNVHFRPIIRCESAVTEGTASSSNRRVVACTIRANPAPQDLAITVGANGTAVDFTRTTNSTEGWTIRFLVDEGIDDESISLRVDDGAEMKLSTVMTESIEEGAGESTSQPTTLLSMNEISVIVGVTGMVVILVGIGIFVVFTRKPTSHDFSIYPNRLVRGCGGKNMGKDINQNKS